MLTTGMTIAVILTVLTVLEYIFAVNMSNDAARFLGLSATAVAKAVLIAYFFMHINRVWRKEAH